MQHHAYLIEDSTALFDSYLASIKEKEKIDTSNPDFFAQKYEKFGIEEARELSTRASFKKVGSRSLFVVGISSITTEAQQALLKLFEEPQEGLVFVVLTPPGLFISTLKSRFLAYDGKISEKQDLKIATKFLHASHKDRSVMIADLLDDEENVKERVRDFLNGLEVVLYMGTPKSFEGLADIAKFRSYVNDRAPSLKMILEHFAATLPQIK